MYLILKLYKRQKDVEFSYGNRFVHQMHLTPCMNHRINLHYSYRAVFTNYEYFYGSHPDNRPSDTTNFMNMHKSN